MLQLGAIPASLAARAWEEAGANYPCAFEVPLLYIPLKLLFRWELFAVENFIASDSGGNKSCVEFPICFSLSLAFSNRKNKPERRGGKRAREMKGLFLPDLSQISQKKHLPL